MNLFRSEDHVRNWSRFVSSAEQGIVPLASVVGLFSGDFFRRRREPGYASQVRKYWGAVLDVLGEMAKDRPFWTPPSS